MQLSGGASSEVRHDTKISQAAGLCGGGGGVRCI